MGLTIQRALVSFERRLRIQGRMPRTIDTHTAAVRYFDTYLDQHDLPRELGHILPDHVEDFLLALKERGNAPKTVLTRSQGLRAFFKWAEENDYIAVNPMARIKVDKVEAKVTPIPREEDIKRVLATCEGRGKTQHRDRRDAAILRLFLGTGIRRGELAALQVDDVNLRDQTVLIRGKSGGSGVKERLLYITDKAADALDRYILKREEHQAASDPALFLGSGSHTHHYAMTGFGIYGVIRRRSRQAGLEQSLHPHPLRHWYTDQWLSKDGLEGDLMKNMGWSPRSGQIRHYAAERASARAREAAKRMKIGEDF